MRLLSAADIESAWPVDAALETMSGALRAIAEGQGVAPERQHLSLPGLTGLLMGASAPGHGLLAKLVSVAPGNPARGLPGTLGAVLLADDATGRPLALLDGTALTARRTAAVSACSIKALAQRETHSALLVGCGTQAASLVRTLDALDRFETIFVHARTPGHADDFIAGHQPGLHARLQSVREPGPALAEARVIVMATNSEQPLFDADQFVPGTHLCAIGSFRAGMCEFDPALCRRSRVFVESRATAAAEGGELIAAREAGWTEVSAWTELGEVLAGEKPGRTDDREITVFKSVGHVLFDLHAARAVYDRALELGLGTTWNP
jgi:ornithine cyclodeaminase